MSGYQQKKQTYEAISDLSERLKIVYECMSDVRFDSVQIYIDAELGHFRNKVREIHKNLLAEVEQKDMLQDITLDLIVPVLQNFTAKSFSYIAFLYGINSNIEQQDEAEIEAIQEIIHSLLIEKEIITKKEALSFFKNFDKDITSDTIPLNPEIAYEYYDRSEYEKYR